MAPEQLRNEKEMPYTVYSELGKVVLNGTISPGSEATSIDVSQLSKGMYSVEIIISQSKEKYSFVKQ